jgi:hypothetical protein
MLTRKVMFPFIRCSIVFLATTLASPGLFAATAEPDFAEFPTRLTYRDKPSWIKHGKKIVAWKLKRKGLPEFRRVFVHQTAAGNAFTCGEVRVRGRKDNLGRYQRFISGGRHEVTFFERRVKHFESAWRAYCRR